MLDNNCVIHVAVFDFRELILYRSVDYQDNANDNSKRDNQLLMGKDDRLQTIQANSHRLTRGRNWAKRRLLLVEQPTVMTKKKDVHCNYYLKDQWYASTRLDLDTSSIRNLCSLT